MLPGSLGKHECQNDLDMLVTMIQPICAMLSHTFVYWIKDSTGNACVNMYMCVCRVRCLKAIFVTLQINL